MINPGFYSFYPSTAVSDYYCWFLALNYPQLDIEKYDDGSWSIIEYYNAPIIPSMTKYNLVLGPMENVDLSFSFVNHWIKKLDLRKREYWATCEAKTKAMEDEKEMLEAHAEDTAERAKNIIMGNDALVERIAKNGIHEIELGKIAKHIPRHQLIGGI